ncbi:MAG: DUF2029 domain-containing protein [Saccharofermentans sp.]|nr:DUF2029 domain-containing protein [Saccharofermentans sp.]
MNLHGIDQKRKYEYFFIICIGAYVLFTIFDFMICKGAVQWETLLNGRDFIADYTNVIGYASNRNPYDSTIANGLQERAYPPLQYVFSYLVSLTVPDMQYYYDIQDFTGMYMNTQVAMLYLLFVVISVIGIFELVRGFKNGSNLVKTLTALALTLSFPVLITIERGNSVLIVIVFVLFYLCFYDHDNRVLREMAFIALALAAGIKLMPAVLGVLLIIEKRWKEVIRTVIYGLASFFLPFLFFEGGFKNVPLFFRNLSLQLEAYKFIPDCTLRGFILTYFPDYAYDNIDSVKTICTVVTLLICTLMLVASFLTKRKGDRLVYLCMLLIIMPSHSASYNLLYLFPCMIALLNETDKLKLDLFILLGGCLSICTLGGPLGSILVNWHVGLLIIIICAIVKSVEVIVKRLDKKNKDAELIY